MQQTLSLRIGMVLRRLRSERGFSQESYADAIGMHRTYYSAIERGEKNMRLDTVDRVCQGLGATMWVVIKEAQDS